MGSAPVSPRSPAAFSHCTCTALANSFKDGETVEFSEELANLYQPAPGGPEAQRLAQARKAEQLRHQDRPG
jgi:hypothetical protein